MPKNPTTKGEASRQQIIQASYRLFLEQGYHATTLRDISRRSNLTLGGVYAHFAGKEEIFVAVFTAYHPFQRLIPAILEAEGDCPEALIRDAAHRMVAALGTQREALNLIFIEIVEFQACHVSELVPIYFPQMVEFAGRLIVGQTGLRPVSPEVLMRSFFGLFFSYYMTQIIMPQLPSNPQILDQFVDLYLHGILIEPSPLETQA